uniref:Chaoptin n=1 Tax=Timema shepardi TaxID=629360 RepID=A0A7R9FZ96_TIMSH|nr:unnamed protein product [Timema shepardi]
MALASGQPKPTQLPCLQPNPLARNPDRSSPREEGGVGYPDRSSPWEEGGVGYPDRSSSREEGGVGYPDRSSPREEGGVGYPDRSSSREEGGVGYPDRSSSREEGGVGYPDRSSSREEGGVGYPDRSSSREEGGVGYPDRSSSREEGGVGYPDRSSSREEGGVGYPDRSSSREEGGVGYPDRSSSREEGGVGYPDRSSSREEGGVGYPDRSSSREEGGVGYPDRSSSREEGGVGYPDISSPREEGGVGYPDRSSPREEGGVGYPDRSSPREEGGVGYPDRSSPRRGEGGPSKPWGPVERGARSIRYSGQVCCLSVVFINNCALNESVFVGMGRIQYLSLADNSLTRIPRHILSQMPHIKTLDIGRGQLQTISETDFQANLKQRNSGAWTPLNWGILRAQSGTLVPCRLFYSVILFQDVTELQHLVLGGNSIFEMDQDSMPRTLRHLHLGRNKITDLNGTLRELSELEWLFINSNQLTSVDDELPRNGVKLMLIHAADNRLQRLPLELKNFVLLESAFFHYNELTRLGGALQKARRLKRLHLFHNQIQELSEDDFMELENLEDLQLGNNLLPSLNGSLLPLRSLRYLNLSQNLLEEFSLQEIRGLRRIRILDLSNNRISRLSGRMENLVELETRVMDLRLENNLLKSLDGSLMGLHGLQILNLSHNFLEKIAPDDLIGLDDLRFLDVSYNQLTTIEETSKTFLPSLEGLIASNNLLTLLDRDFHGLPVLCWADLSNNQITVVGRELASKTRCRIRGIVGTLRIYLQGKKSRPSGIVVSAPGYKSKGPRFDLLPIALGIFPERAITLSVIKVWLIRLELDNPVYCSSDLVDTMAAMETNNTKILGLMPCTPVEQTLAPPAVE